MLPITPRDNIGRDIGLEPILQDPMSCVLGSTTSPIITNRIIGVKEGTRTPRAPFGVPDPQSGRVPITGYNHHIVE